MNHLLIESSNAFVFIICVSHAEEEENMYTATCLPSQKLSKLDEPDTQDTAGKAETSS